MTIKDKIFSSKIKSSGFFDFPALYKFCYDWLDDEEGFDRVVEEKQIEKLLGDAKNIEIKWVADKKINDYFKFEIKVEFRIIGLKKAEFVQEGRKIKTNEGSVEVKVTGLLIKDYQGKFETSSTRKFMRGVYERWIIPAGITAMEDKLSTVCDGFLHQTKAYLDLEGKK